MQAIGGLHCAQARCAARTARHADRSSAPLVAPQHGRGAAAHYKHHQRRRHQCQPQAYSSGYAGAYSQPPEEPPSQQRDLLERAFEFCGAAASRAAAAAVGRATDALQLLVPQSTPRPKVEAAVKGALALLALALVKSVLSVVLVVGAVVLVLYIATQLFGWDVSIEHHKPPGAAAAAAGEPWPGAAWQNPQQQQGYGQQAQQQQQAQQGYPYGGPQGGARQRPRYGPAPGQPRAPQGDVIDVWRQQ